MSFFRPFRKDIGDHVQRQTQKHLQLVCEKLMKLHQIQNTMSSVEATSESNSNDTDDVSPLTRTYSGSTIQSTQRLLKDLFRRMVQLEQKNCQMEIENRRLSERVSEAEAAVEARTREDLGRFCNGKYVWKISGYVVHTAWLNSEGGLTKSGIPLHSFSSFHEKMRHSHSFVLYSKGFYTSPFGYRMCLRCNVAMVIKRL